MCIRTNNKSQRNTVTELYELKMNDPITAHRLKIGAKSIPNLTQNSFLPFAVKNSSLAQLGSSKEGDSWKETKNYQ